MAVPIATYFYHILEKKSHDQNDDSVKAARILVIFSR